MYVNPFMDFLLELNENSVNAKVSTDRSDELSSRGAAYNISLTNALTRNDVELNEAIASGEIELFSKEFEQIPTNKDRLAWMKIKLDRSKEKKRQQREETIKRNPKMKELFERIDEDRASKTKLKWNSS